MYGVSRAWNFRRLVALFAHENRRNVRNTRALVGPQLLLGGEGRGDEGEWRTRVLVSGIPEGFLGVGLIAGAASPRGEFPRTSGNWLRRFARVVKSGCEQL